MSKRVRTYRRLLMAAAACAFVSAAPATAVAAKPKPKPAPKTKACAAAKKAKTKKKARQARLACAAKKSAKKPSLRLAPLPKAGPPAATISPAQSATPLPAAPSATPAPPAPSDSSPETRSADPGPVYWGAWIGSHLTGNEAPWDTNAITAFERNAGKKVSLLHFSSPFGDCYQSPCSYYGFPQTEFTKLRTRGTIPFFSWASNALPTTGDQSNYQLSDILSGRHDAYITQWATAAKNWGSPFFLRFNWEMNGNWFSWSEGRNGNTQGQYVAAWRHVHDIFTRVGATNATWVWCPNVDPDNMFQSLASLYPGAEYVDWTCLDGYNWNTPRRSFKDIFLPTYRQITETVAPGKPMVIGETGSTEAGGSKAAWISDMFGSLALDLPKVRAFMYFQKHDDGMDWPIETSAAATSAFASGIGSPRYTADTSRQPGGLTKVLPLAP
ncbi:MAG: glycosyl hydrolase [Baekduia sp.]